MGIGYEEDRAVGAEIAAIPSGLAGVAVGIRVSIAHAETVPGIGKPPAGWRATW